MSDEPLHMNAVDRSELEGVRIEMTAGFSRMEGKLDAYVQSHANVHQADQREFNEHLRQAAVRQRDIDDLGRLPDRVDRLEDWRIEVRTFGTLIRATFGTSLLAAIGVGVAIAKAFGLI